MNKETMYMRVERINKEAREMQKNCIKHKCKYLKSFMNGKYSGTVMFCDYLCENHKRRGCDPDECTHWMDEDNE